MAIVEARFSGKHPPQRYSLPLAADWSEDFTRCRRKHRRVVLAKVRKGPREGVLYEAAADESFTAALLDEYPQGNDDRVQRWPVPVPPDGGI